VQKSRKIWYDKVSARIRKKKKTLWKEAASIFCISFSETQRNYFYFGLSSFSLSNLNSSHWISHMNPSAEESDESEFASGIKRNEKPPLPDSWVVSERMALESQIMFSLFVKKNSALALVPVYNILGVPPLAAACLKIILWHLLRKCTKRGCSSWYHNKIGVDARVGKGETAAWYFCVRWLWRGCMDGMSSRWRTMLKRNRIKLLRYL
jgi:hypothetical protein